MYARPTSSAIRRASWLTRVTRSGVRAGTGIRLGLIPEGGAESTTQLGHIPVQRVEFAPREVSCTPRCRRLTAAGEGAQPLVDAGEREAGLWAALARQLGDQLELGHRVERIRLADGVREQPLDLVAQHAG